MGAAILVEIPIAMVFVSRVLWLCVSRYVEKRVQQTATKR